MPAMRFNAITLGGKSILKLLKAVGKNEAGIFGRERYSFY